MKDFGTTNGYKLNMEVTWNDVLHLIGSRIYFQEFKKKKPNVSQNCEWVPKCVKLCSKSFKTYQSYSSSILTLKQSQQASNPTQKTIQLTITNRSNQGLGSYTTNIQRNEKRIRSAQDTRFMWHNHNVCPTSTREQSKTFSLPLMDITRQLSSEELGIHLQVQAYKAFFPPFLVFLRNLFCLSSSPNLYTFYPLNKGMQRNILTLFSQDFSKIKKLYNQWIDSIHWLRIKELKEMSDPDPKFMGLVIIKCVINSLSGFRG